MVKPSMTKTQMTKTQKGKSVKKPPDPLSRKGRVAFVCHVNPVVFLYAAQNAGAKKMEKLIVFNLEKERAIQNITQKLRGVSITLIVALDKALSGKILSIPHEEKQPHPKGA